MASTNRANRATYIEVFEQPLDQEARRAPNRFAATAGERRQHLESQQLFKTLHRF
jgi:hypothetical protein